MINCDFLHRTMLLLLALAGSIAYASAQSVCGSIVLSDTLPASYATVYLPSLGVGATADVDGRFLIDGLSDGSYQVEVSYMGYGTQRQDVTIPGSDSLSFSLAEQPLQLSEVFLTPDGRDPAEYILTKVADMAAANRKRLSGYTAQVDYVIAARDLDVLPMLAGKTMMFMLRSVLSLSGYGALFDYCLSNSSVSAQMSVTHNFTKGKTRHSGQVVTHSSPVMDEKVQKQLLKTTAVELYDELYGDDWFYLNPKMRHKRYDFRLCGTYEDGGRTIDVIEGTSRDTTSIRSSLRMLVVEDAWGILSFEYRVSQLHQRTECREVAPGLYLPISNVLEPMGDIDLNSMLREAKDKTAAESKKLSRSDRHAFERVDRILSGERQFRPSMSQSFTARYSGVSFQP